MGANERTCIFQEGYGDEDWCCKWAYAAGLNGLQSWLEANAKDNKVITACWENRFPEACNDGIEQASRRRRK